MPEGERKIRVMVVSSQVAEATLFGRMIDAGSDMRCAGVALSNQEALQRIPETSPDVLVTTVLRQGIEEFFTTLQQSHPQIRLLVNVPNHTCSAPYDFLNLETMLLLESPLTPQSLQAAIRDAFHGKVGCTHYDYKREL